MIDVRRVPRPRSWPGRLGRAVDPYVAALLGTVVLAALLPASGATATAVGVAANIAIGLRGDRGPLVPPGSAGRSDARTARPGARGDELTAVTSGLGTGASGAAGDDDDGRVVVQGPAHVLEQVVAEIPGQ
ncbi:hypothetical protein [Streptomyces sp. NPDC005322]|uniref:hypothetical protein n=1 Tax=unclassified Streptomyces TaxID=2593676 RepID=UPI0033A9FE09